MSGIDSQKVQVPQWLVKAAGTLIVGLTLALAYFIVIIIDSHIESTRATDQNTVIVNRNSQQIEDLKIRANRELTRLDKELHDLRERMRAVEHTRSRWPDTP